MGTCTVEIEHENNKKRCKFFVVPGNGQVSLGMPDIDALNIIKVNIHSIGTKQAGDGDNCHTNKPTAQREDMKQETNRAEKHYKTQKALQNLTINISQWSITNYRTQ